MSRDRGRPTRTKISVSNLLGWGVAAVGVVALACALWSVGLFVEIPGFPRQDETGAALSTANATWWVVVATVASCAAGLTVVYSAFEIQRRQFAEEENTRARRIAENGRDAVDVILRSQVLAQDLTRIYCDTIMPTDREAIWADLSRIRVQHLVIERFIESPLTELTTLFLLAHCNQYLYAARDALKRQVPDDDRTILTDEDRKFTRRTLVAAEKRALEKQAEISAAKQRYTAQ